MNRRSLVDRHYLPQAIRIILLFICLLPATRVNGADIDIMLVYDSTATNWVNSNGGMATFSLDAVNRMNLAAQNSNIDLTFRLVHSVTANYTHQNFDNDLTALTNGSGGFADIHTLRDDYGADLVALLIDTGSAYGTTGLGWILQNYDGSPGYGFTVSAVRSVEISHTLTHEVGHNLGAHHAKNQSSSPGPNTSNYLNAPYSAGWYFTGTNSTKYHTIMAYSRDGYGSYYDSAPLFSTPLLTYEGTVSGDGDDGDNSRLLRDTMAAVAGYRESTLGALTVTIEPFDARTEGARWRRQGTTTWHEDGYLESGLPAGTYTIEFKSIDNWDTPGDLVVDVYAEQTTETDGYYTLIYNPIGSLTVNIEPEDARTAGAQWRRKGTNIWYDSRSTENEIAEGEYTVEFKWVYGWKKPDDAAVTIGVDQLSTIDGSYTLFDVPAPTGWLPLLLLDDE